MLADFGHPPMRMLLTLNLTFFFNALRSTETDIRDISLSIFTTMLFFSLLTFTFPLLPLIGMPLLYSSGYDI